MQKDPSTQATEIASQQLESLNKDQSTWKQKKVDNSSTWVYVLKCLLEDKSNVFWDGKLKLLRQVVEKLITCGWKDGQRSDAKTEL